MANITLRSVKGSALTFQEADDNFLNLDTNKIESVSDDTAPSLGGDLNTGNFAITSDQGIIKLAGPILADSFEFDEGLFLSAMTSPATSIGLFLGHNLLDEEDPGSSVEIFQDRISLVIDDNDIVEVDEDGITVNGSINGLSYPNSDGSAGQILSTDGNGNIVFVNAPSGGIASVSADTAPVLGGDLDIGEFAITSSEVVIGLNGIVVPGSFEIDEGLFLSAIISPDTSLGLILGHNLLDEEDAGSSVEIFQDRISLVIDDNDIVEVDEDGILVRGAINGYNLPNQDGSDGQVLVTDGSGTLSFENRVNSADVLNIVKLTQAQYDALNPPVSTTLYLIEED